MADAFKVTGVRHARHLLRGCTMLKESSSLLQADRRVMIKQRAASVGFSWLRRESGGSKPFLFLQRWPVEDRCFIYAQHIGRVNIKKHTSGDSGDPSISPRCYPRENTRRQTRTAPRRHESVLCPSTTFLLPPKKEKRWHSFLEDAHREGPAKRGQHPGENVAFQRNLTHGETGERCVCWLHQQGERIGVWGGGGRCLKLFLEIA